jgi:hypothetical protein
MSPRIRRTWPENPPRAPLGRSVAQLARDSLGLGRRGEGWSELAERCVRLALPGADTPPDGEDQPGRLRVNRHRGEQGHAGVELLDGVVEAPASEQGRAREELRIAARPEIIRSRQRAISYTSTGVSRPFTGTGPRGFTSM